MVRPAPDCRARCVTQVIVVRSSDSPRRPACRRVPMIPLDAEKSADVQLGPGLRGRHRDGQALRRRGRRTAGHQGGCRFALSIGTTPLEQKTAKPLPASD